MIGIYKITNKINGKSYIGQSSNIERRFLEHMRASAKSRIPFAKAVKKHGKENFYLTVLEECSKDRLNEREMYWIGFYETFKLGYNCNYGGSQESVGSSNGRAILTEYDVIKIRKYYLEKNKTTKQVYSEYEKKITYNSFMNIWNGNSWSHILPEVYTKDNREYYSKQASSGERSVFSKFTNEEVLELRTRYINETAKEIYKGYEDIISYSTLQAMLWGRSYREVPVYSKKEKQWILP